MLCPKKTLQPRKTFAADVGEDEDDDLTQEEIDSEEASDYTADMVESYETRPQTWVIEDMIVDDDVIGFYGDGGSGKTYVMLQLLLATTAGVSWLGKPTSGPVRTLFVSVKNADAEDHGRLKAIMEGLTSPYSGEGPDAIKWHDLAGFKVKILADRDAILARLDDRGRKIVTTKRYKQVKEWIRSGNRSSSSLMRCSMFTAKIRTTFR